MVKVAQIINTHGLKGECKVYLLTDDAKNRFKKGQTLHFEDGTAIKVLKYREQKGFGYVYLEGVETIEKAEELKWKYLMIDEEDLPQLNDGEYYYHQLNACTVINQNDEELGKVVDILETGANLVLRVQAGKEEFLLPFVAAFIKDVDVENKKIYIEEMEGLR